MSTDQPLLATDNNHHNGILCLMLCNAYGNLLKRGFSDDAKEYASKLKATAERAKPRMPSLAAYFSIIDIGCNGVLFNNPAETINVAMFMLNIKNEWRNG